MGTQRCVSEACKEQPSLLSHGIAPPRLVNFFAPEVFSGLTGSRKVAVVPEMGVSRMLKNATALFEELDAKRC